MENIFIDCLVNIRKIFFLGRSSVELSSPQTEIRCNLEFFKSKCNLSQIAISPFCAHMFGNYYNCLPLRTAVCFRAASGSKQTTIWKGRSQGVERLKNLGMFKAGLIFVELSNFQIKDNQVRLSINSPILWGSSSFGWSILVSHYIIQQSLYFFFPTCVPYVAHHFPLPTFHMHTWKGCWTMNQLTRILNQKNKRLITVTHKLVKSENALISEIDISKTTLI